MFNVFEKGALSVALAILELTDQADLELKRSDCLSLLSAGVKGVHQVKHKVSMS